MHFATNGGVLWSVPNWNAAPVSKYEADKMTNAQIDYLLGRPAQGYRAGTVDADAVLISPDGKTIATFLDLDDAIHAADAINRAADDAGALALAAGALKAVLVVLAATPAKIYAGPTRDELRILAFDALAAIESAPGRAVGAIATGPGGGL